MTIADSFGEVAAIMTTAPMPSSVLRSAIEAVAPTVDLICVVSAVSRETISPDWARSKNAGDSRVTWAKTFRRRSATTRSPIEITK